ncbi:glycoside hydrolase family 88 protein [Actinoplanes sp. TRM 88003]|uniref:Glycoside hydrolase family 88 protein n=1 Tax=Paractinoplanes aksuensis TaxID=2939490 RepID=A0ABT1DQV7_9ACTN|nr:glycoside hydrolase family 88 protein [Actinoplanes aksuensis]MCO8273195.1 glycoside hydrolase family 88 protein [Actinoplanes aksuensis]
MLDALLAMQRQSWEQGVASQAALDLGRDDLAHLMAESAVARQAPDGRLGGPDDNAVNGAACGEAVVRAGFTDAARRQLDFLLGAAPRTTDGTICHVLGSSQVWADTVYMVVPFLALSGELDEAVRQVHGHRRHLCRDGLYSAISPVRPAHWGGGNGWVVAGIARAVRLAPALLETDLPAHAREVLDACLPLRRPDGLFHDVLDDPATFRESNAAQMFAYAALTGATDGWLPPEYATLGHDLLAAATAEVDNHGLVQNACGTPTFDHPGTSPEAQAFHLLATVAATPPPPHP